MTLYSVILHPHAVKKDLPKLPKNEAKRTMERIAQLAKNPRPKNSTKLSNREEYRLRQGNYRVLYLINDSDRSVYITKIRHRSEVYKGL